MGREEAGSSQFFCLGIILMVIYGGVLYISHGYIYHLFYSFSFVFYTSLLCIFPKVLSHFKDRLYSLSYILWLCLVPILSLVALIITTSSYQEVTPNFFFLLKKSIIEIFPLFSTNKKKVLTSTVGKIGLHLTINEIDMTL